MKDLDLDDLGEKQRNGEGWNFVDLVGVRGSLCKKTPVANWSDKLFTPYRDMSVSMAFRYIANDPRSS